MEYLDARLNNRGIGNSFAKYRRPRLLLRLRFDDLNRTWDQLGDVKVDADGNKTGKTATQKMYDLEDRIKGDYFKAIQKTGIKYGIENPDSDSDIHEEFASCIEVIQTKGPNGKTLNNYLKMTPKQIKRVRKNTYALLDDLVGYLNKCDGSPQSQESLRWILEVLMRQ